MSTQPRNYITGEYAVGTTCFSVIDNSRKEILGGGNGNRRMAVRMYYPTDKEAVKGNEKAEIFSENKRKAVQKAFHVKRFDPSMNVADYYENAPIVADERFPLILFNHGYNSFVEANTYLCCDLASHGYVIASIGHAYEAVENDYEDGSFDLYDKSINKKMYTSVVGAVLAQNKLLKKQLSYEEALAQFDVFQNKYTPFMKTRIKEWAKDVICVLETVKQKYEASLDLTNGVGISGHSFGGCVAYYLCRYYEGFTCAVNIDGALFGDYPDSMMEKPFCQISCKENVNVETRTLLHTNAPTYQVVFDRLKHLGFTDLKFWAPMPMLVGKLDADEMHENLSYCHYTFFDKYLKGQDKELTGLGTEGITYRVVKGVS
ncbi:MAG: hypothetical protein PUD20_10350 [bacterium]|nr:hypothetical protein [bacterium]